LDGFEFSVADEGPGIPKEEIPNLFTKFYQIDSSSTRKIGGTGLGLVIAKQLVELHHGTIQVNSIFGKGSVFTVKIPQPIPAKTISKENKKNNLENGIENNKEKRYQNNTNKSVTSS
jgi:signal transduction histidine kinase